MCRGRRSNERVRFRLNENDCQWHVFKHVQTFSKCSECLLSQSFSKSSCCFGVCLGVTDLNWKRQFIDHYYVHVFKKGLQIVGLLKYVKKHFRLARLIVAFLFR